MRILDAIDQFQTQLHADGRSPHTVAQYARHVRRFATWLADHGVDDELPEILPEHIACFIAAAEVDRRADVRSRRTGSLNALRSSLRGFFGYLERAGLIERNPARVVRMARVAPPVPRGMRSADIAKLLAILAADDSVAGRRDHALVAFLAGTGARLGSALPLDVADLDLAEGTATLREVKGGGAMTVFLRPELGELLARWVGDRRSGPVFASRDGEALTARQAQRRFEHWLRVAGIRGRYSPHSLRHAFALGLYERTGDVLVVQAALGHRAITSTMVYARASAERVRAAVVG